MSFSRALAIAALLAAGACTDKSEGRSAEPEQRRAEEAKEVEAERAHQPDKTPSQVTAPVAAPDQEAPPSAAQLPVPEDFQTETAATIMRANYLSELDKLETEVRADEN
jgi:hypothetical protein